MSLSGACVAAQQPNEQGFSCFTCGKPLELPVVGGSASFLTSYMDAVQKRGCWREGSHLYIPCTECDMRHMRVDLAKARLRYSTPKGDIKCKHLTSIGTTPFRNTSFEFLPIDLPIDDAAFNEIYNFYVEYQQARDPLHIDSRERFWHVKCNSVVGSITKENLCLLNANGVVDSKGIIGSCFVRLSVSEKLEAVLLLDFLGEYGLGAKTFWFRTQNSAYKSTTGALVFKLMEVAWRVQAPHLYMSVYDPENPRLRYKTRYLPVAEMLRRGVGWYPAEGEISPSGKWKQPSQLTAFYGGA